MKIILDTDTRTLELCEEGMWQEFGLYTGKAFEILSREWVRVGWSLGYYRNFNWFGRPVLQLPEDLIRLQEAVYRLRPDVIVETGVFKGGSLLFHASLCEALGKGRVIGVDLHIPPDVREAVEGNPLASRIAMLEGDSTAPETVAAVAAMIRPGETALVILDACHEKAHVRRELEAYSAFVTPGSYIVVADGFMRDLADVPGGQPEWVSDNPLAAAIEFAQAHPEFTQEQPQGETTTYWTGGWLRRK